MTKIFGDFEVSAFWDTSEYSVKEYEGQTLTQAMLDSVQSELGYQLPVAYVDLMRIQNGGIPKPTEFKTLSLEPTIQQVFITGLYGFDNQKPRSLCGAFGSRFWINEWGYPPIGIYFSDGPGAGHYKLCLDYTSCDSAGEPSVVQVDQESDYKIERVCDTFEQFIRGLKVDRADLPAFDQKKIISVKKSAGFETRFKKYLK